ncbi:MAG TPA: MBL fold metallo-hydrolase, partial [Dehalococcoidia bacterium]|nr:MBL fold metallo-hydrolase [Dehalococcoidia bacterium]
MAEKLSITFLGSGNAFAPGRLWNAFLVNDRYLFDPSPAALPQMKALEKRPNDVELIFVSHFHADHWFGLPFLLLDYVYGDRRVPLTVIGPPGIEERVRMVTEAGFPRVADEAATKFGVRWVEIDDGAEGEAGGVRYEVREVVHAKQLQCFGFRTRIAGRTLAYSGDTILCQALVPLALGADVFVVECACWESACGPHL